ncbi:hypothetical protein SE1_00566 [Enterococcus hirae EnGen0127]|uniref:P-loop NTPase fold protein n=1 Tax=Enterococcus hirae TaxID=1354 RepID=UPI000330195C|nr:P-loop NTPase fold protein [Enterococcus hirae]EOF60597.1 hypothetical protein SE1_00566 [Enterococcus hirae EnGen0127]
MKRLWHTIKRFFSHSIKNYFTIYNKKYDIINTAVLGTVLTILVVFIDNKNSISILLSKVPNNIIPAFLLLGVILIILFFIKYKLLKSLKYPLINRFDYLLLLAIVMLLLFTVVSILIHSNFTFKMICIKYLMTILLLFLLIRILNVGNIFEVKESTIIDLNEVNCEKISYDKPFLIRENAVGYDLLNRTSQINDLIEIMTEYNSAEKFVIGLEGAWGSGKSTFLNNMKKNISENKDFVVVDDFEPWLSENKEALLNNLLNTILIKSNLDIPSREIDVFIKTISELVLGKKYTKPIINIIENFDQKRESNMISDINYMINKNGKKIIFIVDNLDRLKPDNVFLILNIVNNVLNFDNLIIILSYDEEELSKSLDRINVSPHYLNKIVQKKIVLPVLSKTQAKTIYYQTFTKLLKGKNLEYNSTDIQDFVNIITDNQVNLREFKRFLNSSVLPFVFNSRNISIIDYLGMEYIRIYNYDLYRTVYSDSRYFISSDKGIDEIFRYVDDKEFDDEMNTYFDKIGIKKDIYGNLLELSFPYVKNFFETKVNYKNCVDNSSYRKIQFNKRISSAKFFDLYFTEHTNHNYEINNTVKEFIKKMNLNDQSEDIMSEFMDFILNKDDKSQLEFLSAFYLQLSEIKLNAIKRLATLFLNNYFRFGNHNEALVMGTKSRVAQIITELIENLDQEDFQNILQGEVNNLEKITMVLEIDYWLKHSIKNNQDKIEYLNKEVNNFIEEILDNKLNLFEKDVYVRKISIKIYNYLEEKGSSYKFKNYLNQCINEENYFRVLNDLVMVTSDYLGVVYSMIPEFEMMIDKDKLISYGELVQPVTEQQKFLKNVFENHLKKGKEELGQIGVRLVSPIDLGMVDG